MHADNEGKPVQAETRGGGPFFPEWRNAGYKFYNGKPANIKPGESRPAVCLENHHWPYGSCAVFAVEGEGRHLCLFAPADFVMPEAGERGAVVWSLRWGGCWVFRPQREGYGDYGGR